ncbi:MAG: integrase core domain-containing protein [Ktedonobacteraceae bacterium]
MRRECLDHFLIFQEKQLHRLLNAYAMYFNQARPHQGLGQRIRTRQRFLLLHRNGRTM